LLSELPTLALAGNGYRGIGVPDCIRTGNEAANRVLAVLGMAVVKTSAALPGRISKLDTGLSTQV
jgi:hypothetical protein